eukprot:10711569-Prorocentrum_lima.AAC.1
MAIRTNGVTAWLSGLTFAFPPSFSFQKGTLLLTGLDVIVSAALRAQKMRYPAIVGLTPVDEVSASC